MNIITTDQANHIAKCVEKDPVNLAVHILLKSVEKEAYKKKYSLELKEAIKVLGLDAVKILAAITLLQKYGYVVTYKDDVLNIKW